MRRAQNFHSSALPTELPSSNASKEQGIWNAEVPAQANSSRTIEIDGLNLAVVAVHVQSDRTAANFAILNRGKRAGRGVDDSGEDRSAVGANNARLYFKVHRPM